jgi:hypothetical protein
MLHTLYPAASIYKKATEFIAENESAREGGEVETTRE